MFSLNEIETILGASVHAGRTAGCMFCNVDEDLVIGETENLWLIRDKYPIVDGHLMVISKDHYGCMGELPPSHFAEIEGLRSLLPYDQFVAYEHGRAGHCVKLKGSQITCHHFHLHFLPLDVDLRLILKDRFVPHALHVLKEVRTHFETFGDYLFFETSRGEKTFYPASQGVESHLLRTLVCDAIQRPERADWEAL